MDVDDYLRGFRAAEPPSALRVRVIAAMEREAWRSRRAAAWRAVAALVVIAGLAVTNAAMEQRLARKLGAAAAGGAETPTLLGERQLGPARGFLVRRGRPASARGPTWGHLLRETRSNRI